VLKYLKRFLLGTIYTFLLRSAEEAAYMIAEAEITMKFRGSSEDITRSFHVHPTFTEAFKEVCLAVNDREIHS